MQSTTDMRSIVKVEGPVPVTAESGNLFGGASSPIGLPDPCVSDLLPAHGYVEEEFFISGTVRDQPYTTTLLIRRPIDVGAFSGLVALEPVHLQGALGLWQTCHPAILSGGHVWVTVGSQFGAVEDTIKPANPVRYASLNVPSAPASEETLAQLQEWSQSDDPSVPKGLFQADPISNEILAQAGALLRSGRQDGPIPGFAVEYLILGGSSQTGGATLNFIKGAHAAARLPDGKPIYDGFLPMAASGWEPVSGGDAAVIHIFAEGDLTLFGSIGPEGYMAARPDGDAPDDRYRCYQITGASHLPTRGLRNVAGIPQLGVALKPGERLTQFPAAPFYHAAFVRLQNWLMRGVTPPHAAPIEIAQGAIVADEWGNARGGIRSPYVDVPIARQVPAFYVRNLIGIDLPFSSEQLRQLYGSRDSYLARFDQSMDRAVAEGWVVPADAERLKREEADNAPL